MLVRDSDAPRSGRRTSFVRSPAVIYRPNSDAPEEAFVPGDGDVLHPRNARAQIPPRDSPGDEGEIILTIFKKKLVGVNVMNDLLCHDKMRGLRRKARRLVVLAT